MIEVSIYEEKFLEILSGKISIEIFENWIYENEKNLPAQLPGEIYNELLLIDYRTKESKYDLAKALNIDYEKLELYEIQQLIKTELENEPILNRVNYEIDAYELGFILLDFEIGALKFRMHNPFKIETFAELNDEERENIFASNFGSGKQFLKYLLDSIGTDNFRVHNWMKHEQTDSMTETKLMQTRDDEYKIRMNGHFCHIKKEYIKRRMKKAWL